MKCCIILYRTLYRENRLPKNVHIVGYARTNLTVADLRKNADPYVLKKEDKTKYDKFWNEVNQYDHGDVRENEDFKKLDAKLNDIEKLSKKANRLYYMALPASVYQNAIVPLKAQAMAKK